jgi:hypothetical protein
MVSKNTLISKLDPFLGKKDVLVYNQDTMDIIDGILKNHQKYEKEYDKIYRYFVEDENTDQTAYNVWCFLKDNFNYVIEPEKMQVLRSPAAILGSSKSGIDCKGFASFAAGVMSAWKRNEGKKFDVMYRFASYDPFDKTPQHVFAVVKEKGKEYWIDPVLDEYDQKKQPYFYKDKKINDMALVALSGVEIGSHSKMGELSMDANGNYFDTSGMVVDQSGNLPTASGTSSSSFDWTSIFGSLLKVAPVLLQPKPTINQYGQPYGSPYGSTMPPVQKAGISTNTLLLIAAAGLGVYFFTKKSR